MTELVATSRALTPQQIIARIVSVDGPNSKIDADLVVTPVPRISSFGGFPSVSSAVASVPPDPSATFTRFSLGA